MDTLSTADTNSTYRWREGLGCLPISCSCNVAASRASSLLGTPQPGQDDFVVEIVAQTGDCGRAVLPELSADVGSCQSMPCVG